MATGKKFYWLKLSKDFFKRTDVKIIEAQDNGKDYVLFYLKLLVESIEQEGYLRFNETIPYNEKMLATITDTNIDVVRQAIKIFSNLGLMEIYDDKTIYMKEMDKLLGYETDWAKKKREQRSRKNLVNNVESGDNVSKLSLTSTHDVLQEKDIDIELDIDKDKKKENSIINNTTKEKIVKHIYGEFKHVRLSDREYEKLKLDFPNEYKDLIKNLDEYIEMRGTTYKNHNLTIRNWKKREKNTGKFGKPQKNDVNIEWLKEFQ